MRDFRVQHFAENPEFDFWIEAETIEDAIEIIAERMPNLPVFEKVVNTDWFGEVLPDARASAGGKEYRITAIDRRPSITYDVMRRKF